ncbi:hypothetical protein [Vannielia litorea]|uniref:Uncharacterized protein n=1 Tax=Vannielia litorea TaxID=1217970 RepID=A0A1N6HPN3_9RHOB|nr:hypothetical protein [Vannielia litorea]SIO21721.1 hypothetical protein SAMN05444002_3574 [Vannielia litorea]
MTEPIEMDCRLDRRAFRQALDHSERRGLRLVLPLARWAVILAVAALMLKADWGLPPEAAMVFVLGAAIWAGMDRILHAQARAAAIDEALRQQAQDGGYRLRFGPEGLRHEGRTRSITGTWDSYLGAEPAPGATAVRMAGIMIWILDEHLPDGLNPEAFRAALDRWKAAG